MHSIVLWLRLSDFCLWIRFTDYTGSDSRMSHEWLCSGKVRWLVEVFLSSASDPGHHVFDCESSNNDLRSL